LSPEEYLLDRAHMLNLTAPEMTVCIAGLRTLLESKVGQFTNTPGVLDNSWFDNLLSMDYEWKPNQSECMMYDGMVRKTGNPKYKATQVDLVFGSNSQLRAISEF